MTRRRGRVVVRRRALVAVLAVHRVAALATALGLGLYAVTGFAMVHPALVPGAGAERTRTLPWPATAPRDPEPAAPASAARDPEPAALAARARELFGLRGRLESAERTDTGGYRLVFRRPGTRAEVALASAAGPAVLRVQTASPARHLKELHEFRGYDGGWPYRLWALWIDVVALALVLFAVSGVALWALLRPDRLGAAVLTGSTLYALGSVAWLWLSP